MLYGKCIKIDMVYSGDRNGLFGVLACKSADRRIRVTWHTCYLTTCFCWMFWWESSCGSIREPWIYIAYYQLNTASSQVESSACLSTMIPSYVRLLTYAFGVVHVMVNGGQLVRAGCAFG